MIFIKQLNRRKNMPLDLPPPQLPTMEVRKMDQKESLIQKIKGKCELSVRNLKDEDTEGLGNLQARAYFLDVCNATNANEIFSYKIASLMVTRCQDGFVPRATDNWELSRYHIEDEDHMALHDILQEEGKGELSYEIMPPVSISKNYEFALKTIYTIMRRDPGFNPQFTTFTFGGTMADMPPLRLENGEPNPEFFQVWEEKTDKFFKIK